MNNQNQIVRDFTYVDLRRPSRVGPVRMKLNDRLTPQVSKVQAACSGLFFEVSSQYNQPSKGVHDSWVYDLAVVQDRAVYGQTTDLRPPAPPRAINELFSDRDKTHSNRTRKKSALIASVFLH
jgi:hypothetical protein